MAPGAADRFRKVTTRGKGAMKAAVLYEAGRPMPGGAIGALTDLRDQGVLGYLGVAGGEVPLLREFVATGLLDVVLSPSYACRPTGEAVRDAVRAMQRACAGY